MLRHKVSTSFAEMTAHAKDKVEVIVSFLAMLELIKQRLVHVDQSGGLFTDIQLKKISS